LCAVNIRKQEVVAGDAVTDLEEGLSIRETCESIDIVVFSHAALINPDDTELHDPELTLLHQPPDAKECRFIPDLERQLLRELSPQHELRERTRLSVQGKPAIDNVLAD
jgi:hypothetical protein